MTEPQPLESLAVPLGSQQGGAAPEVTRLPVPLAVVLVVALLVAAGGFLFIWALVELPNAIKLFGNDPLGTWLSLVVLMLVLLVGAMGAGLLFLARRLLRADRVGRGVTYVACLSVAASILLGANHTTGLTLAAVGCIAAVAALALLPDVQAFFTGPAAPAGDRPYGVVIAQTLIAVWLFIVAVVGAMYLMLGFAGAGAKYVIVGLIVLGIGAASRSVNARLSNGEAGGRNAASIGAAAVVLLDLVAGNTTGTGFLLPFGWSIGIVAYLWLPQDSQAFFASPSPAPQPQ
jgi:hypothetical protein